MREKILKGLYLVVVLSILIWGTGLANLNINVVEAIEDASTGPYCGDGIQNNDEECDDGNNNNNDFCSNQCEEQTPICHATHSPTHPYNFLWVANNAQNGGGANDHSGHESDIIPITDVNGDGVINIDDCNSYQHYCGDGVVHGDEECDDGPDGSDTCTDECTFIGDPYCGDGITTPPEECDDGNNISGDGCDAQCIIEYCGDGIVNNNTEECDDGNTANGDGCSAECMDEYCGDGIINQGWEECDGDSPQPCIDDDGYDGMVYCDDCMWSDCESEEYCGDGIQNGPEECDDGPSGSESCTPNCTIIEEETITVLAYKVVCEDESYLPNWGTSGIQGAEPGTIGPNTAQDYVDASNGHCWLEENWDFQWGYNGQAQKQTGTHVGPAPSGTGWNDFDTSTANNGQTPASVSIGNLDGENTLWFRENLKQNYIPFSYPPDASPGSDISAEFYCHNDILKYDNYDYIQNFQSGNTYYCIGFNAPLEEEPNELTIYAEKIVCEDETDLPNWNNGADITANTAQDYVDAHPNCHFEEEWDFQWAVGLADPGENYYGFAPGWNNFNSSTGNGTAAMVVITDQDIDEGNTIKLREVLKQGYIPFSYSSAAVPGQSPPGSDVSAEFWCYTDVENYDNYDYINGSEWGETYYCVAFNTLLEDESPYCGDGTVNQDWEQCDGECGCTPMCLWPEPEECNDLVLAKIHIEDVQNWNNGNMTNDLFLGSDSYKIPHDVWFALYWNGSYYTDPDIAGYEDVPGLAVQRLEDDLRVVMYGTGTSGEKEHVSGHIEFYNATVTGQDSDESNDNPGNNRLENGFDGNGVGSYNAGNDEVWQADGKSYYWLTTTTADDGYYTNWQIIEDCEEYCGDGIQNGDEECDGEDGLLNSRQTCSEQCTIINSPCDPNMELMVNGSFETPVGTNPVGWDIYPNTTPGLNWHTYWETDITSYGGHNRPEIANLELHFGVAGWPAADGDQYAELDGDWDGPGGGINGEPASTRISQVIETLPNETYEIKFWFKARPNTNLDNNKVQLRINGVDKYAVTADSSGNWNEYSFSFTAIAYYTIIGFADIGTPEDSLGSFLDNVSSKCVFEEDESPYCGDGIVNQEWEQCDDGGGPRSVGCSEQCQYVVPQDCSDLVLAKVNVDEVNNFTGNGDISSNIYLGSDSYIIPAGTWFALYWNGSYYTDPDIAAYEDVPGLAVQRLEGSVRAVLYGSWLNASKEHIHGNIEFYNADVLAQRNDPSNDNPKNNTLENGFDGTGVGSYNAGNDEVWLEDGDTNHSYFWLTTTTADDGYYTDWQIIEDCNGGNVCGIKFFDIDQDGIYNNDDYNIIDWMISLWPKRECVDEEEWADEVISFDQGLKANGVDPVAVGRSDPDKALNEAQRDDTMNFVSLGFAGELILKFDNFIENRTGDDIEVVETSFGSPACNAYPETVKVYASKDGIAWEDLGSACLDGTFDLGSLDWAQYVKLVDETDSNQFSGSADGYDIDGVRAIHCLTVDETAELTTYTTENGYCFENLEAKRYYVCEETREFWINTTPICHQILVGDGVTSTIDFGNYMEEEPEPYLDFGDAPDSYGTLLISNGARHTFMQAMYMGLLIDTELDGQPSIPADGDDILALDDEDGITFLSQLIQGSTASIDVLASAPALLQAWIDFNYNGVFDHPAELIAMDYPVVPGSNIITFPVPSGAVVGQTYARFRLSSVQGLPPTGSAPDGEVEDYTIEIISSIPDPICGNGVLEGNEQCDDGNNNNGDGCDMYCIIEGNNGPICGNGVLECGEECDDGNTNNGDGCSATCTTEGGGGGSIVFTRCNPRNVDNGIIGSYPNCTITCYDGYVLDNNKCIKEPGEVLGEKIEDTGEVLGVKILPETGTDNHASYLLIISTTMLLIGALLRLKSEEI